MAQFKKTKKGPLMSVTIPKLDTKQGKKLNELSVRAGAISRAIPPPENAKKKESTQPDMLHSLNTSKSKKYGVSSSNTPLFNDSHKPVEAKPPLVKSKHSIPVPPSGIHVKNVKTSFHEQTASFKTKAEKKSMSLEKLDERIGEDSISNTYWYNGSKKIFKMGVGQQERELVSNGQKDCLKLIKSLSQSSKNQDLITKLQESILPQIKFSKTKKHRDKTEWSSTDTKQHHDKKSQKTHSSSSSSLFQSSFEAKHSKYKKSTLTESSFSKSIEELNQVHPSVKKDSIHSKTKDVNKLSFTHKQTLVEHKQTPEFSNSPHKLSKPNSNESTQSLADIKHIDPSNIPINVTPTQRKKKRGRPPGPSDKTKKKLANKPLSIQQNRGRPKKNPLLTKLKKFGSPNITQEFSKKMSHQIRVNADEFKKQKADKKVFLEVQETSANIDNIMKEDSKQRIDVKRKDDKIVVSKTSNPPFISTNPKKTSPTRKRAVLSSSSDDDDSESSCSKPPRAKTKHFRSSKSSESDTPDVPKTPGPISSSPHNPWREDSKNESNKSSKVKLNTSPYRKVTETVTIPSAPSRGKYMPKRYTRPQNENISPHRQTARPNEDSYDHHTSSPRTNTHPGKTIANSKLNISVPEQKLSRVKQTDSNKLIKQDSLGNQSTAPVAESSDDSSTDSTDSDSSSSSDESDDSPTKVSDVTSLSQPISSQSSAVAKPPTTGGQEHPRVAYVFTTELANKAAAAVRRGDVKTIVEFHQRFQPPLAHLKLSTERRQNLENRNKSPGQPAGSVADMSGKKMVDKSLLDPDTSSSETTSSSDEDSESSGQESRAPSPAPAPALHKPVPVEPVSLEEQIDNSDASSDQQDDLMSPRQMIPKTPGPPPGKNLVLSDDESEIEVPARRTYRGKSQINLSPGRDTDNSDLLEDMNMVPKTPGAGLMKHLELSDDEDDDVMDGKDQSDDDKISFDKPPPAPRPPRTPDEDDESQTRDFDNILRGLNSSPMSKSPSISPLELQLQARPAPPSLPNTTPRLSPYTNPLSNHASSSNNPSAKSTPTIVPMGSGSNGSPYLNQLQNTEGQHSTNAPTPLDNRSYAFPNLPQGPQFNSHYSSPSRTPLHTMDQIHCSTPSQLHEVIAAPYRTPDTRRANFNKLPHSELQASDIGMLTSSARKDSIDSNTGIYQPPLMAPQQQQQQQQRFSMNMPYYYQNKQQAYPGISPININYNLPQKHPQILMRPQMEQNPYSQANNVTSPLYIPEHTSLATDMTARYPTESLPPNIRPAATNGQYYSPSTPGYTRMSTPEHGYPLQSTLPSHMNRPLPPTYVNGDPRFNNLTTQMAPPPNLLLGSETVPLSRTFSEFSTPNLQGTPIDTNIANLNPTLHMIPENTTPRQLNASISQEEFNFSETIHSPIVSTTNSATTSPPLPVHKQTTSCSTSPPPQPIKAAPKTPKPLMVDRVMQTDGDDTWDNSKPEMDIILESEIKSVTTTTTTTTTTTSSECQTETVTHRPKVVEVKIEPAVWDPSTGQKEKQEDEEVLMVRIPTHLLSKETKFLNGKIADDFIDVTELPKLTPLNLKDREKLFRTKVGWAGRCADFQRKYYDNPPPLRSLFTSERDIPQLKPIKSIRTNGFGPSPQVAPLDFRDLPKLRPIIPLIVSNNS